jgi:hypothetical protein
MGTTDVEVTLYNGDRIAGSWKIADCQSTVDADQFWWDVFTIDGMTNQLKWNCNQGPVRTGPALPILHHVDTCGQCGTNWCDNYAIDAPDVESSFVTGSSLSTWGCSQTSSATLEVRDSQSGAIYAVETSLATLHYVSECTQCGLQWCGGYDLNVPNVESFFSGTGSGLGSGLQCSQVGADTVKVRNSETGQIYAVVSSSGQAPPSFVASRNHKKGNSTEHKLMGKGTEHKTEGNSTEHKLRR